jgi:hypothetical protein
MKLVPLILILVAATGAFTDAHTAHGNASSTIVAYSTYKYTITSCAPSVTDCPANSKTVVVPIYSTIAPVNGSFTGFPHFRNGSSLSSATMTQTPLQLDTSQAPDASVTASQSDSVASVSSTVTAAAVVTSGQTVQTGEGTSFGSAFVARVTVILVALVLL